MNPYSSLNVASSNSVMGNISYAIKICAAMSILGLIIKFAVSSYEASILGLGLIALSLFGSMMMVLKYYYSTGSDKSFSTELFYLV